MILIVPQWWEWVNKVGKYIHQTVKKHRVLELQIRTNIVDPFKVFKISYKLTENLVQQINLYANLTINGKELPKYPT